MRSFHVTGTLWTSVDHIIETPMFVDSKLTRLVQIADLCAYALRRCLENGESDLFKPVFKRADRIGDIAVGYAISAHRSAVAPSVSRTDAEH